MPSIYDFRHVELDKVGRGKRIIKAPGGGAHNIFGQQSSSNEQLNGGKINGSNGTFSETDSIDGSSSILSCPSTPVHSTTNGSNGVNGNNNNLQFGYESDTSSQTTQSSIATTPTAASATTPSSSRRGSLQETKNRLFGQPEVTDTPRRRVVDRMKSNIFAEPDPSQQAAVVRTPSVKKYEHVINRNPITGEIINEHPTISNGNGMANGNGSMNGSNGSMPNTPTRVRQPPGGKTSNIFG